MIKDHSTIGIVVTTDGSIGELTRNDYLEAEERVVGELKEIGKPFIVLLNSTHPMLPETERLSEKLTESYRVPVLPVSVENMTCLLYTSPSPRDQSLSRMPSSA